jgi:hypothetical protein
VRIHPSRVVPFIGQKAPEGGFYGVVLVVLGRPDHAVDRRCRAQCRPGAKRVLRADRPGCVDVIKLKDLMSIVGTVKARPKIAAVSAPSQGKSTWRAAVLDMEDEWQQLQVNWPASPRCMDSFLLIVAGAADIPMTRLLGQSPKGLQSTGDGEERDYLAMIQARQDEHC